MTVFQHNKLVGALHLVYTGLNILLLGVIFVFVFGAMGIGLRQSDEAVPIGPIIAIMIFAILINLLMILPSVLAGYGLLKRKRWAKTAGVIASIAAGLNFPFGSALCVYTLWFLFGDHGRFLYGKAAYALPAGQPRSDRTGKLVSEREYVPPSAPPDWR